MPGNNITEISLLTWSIEGVANKWIPLYFVEFREIPKSDAPIIFSLSPVTTGIYVACIGSGVGISEAVLFISVGSDLLVTGCSSHIVNS